MYCPLPQTSHWAQQTTPQRTTPQQDQSSQGAQHFIPQRTTPQHSTPQQTMPHPTMPQSMSTDPSHRYYTSLLTSQNVPPGFLTSDMHPGGSSIPYPPPGSSS